MANLGDRFKTGDSCVASGSYVFDGYTSEPSTPQPTQEERVIPLERGRVFPPIRSTNRGAYWKLQRLQ
ncbi:YjzC family protein [Nannocystis punicea]|uniref:YjzC family protein n=1 Tax=Nannocystis punicea TaxID=2995304 RepID=A0ABY7H1N5_9BACT|nr:YjzC family protein [Nannocystis poenicansa]WAS93161.1 YjzC family protein [Nannocystis poenicansa]